MLASLHFLRPAFFWLLLPMLVILWRLSQKLRPKSNWEGLCDPHLLAHLLQQQSHKFNALPLVILSTAWLLALIALAGPTWSKAPQPIFRNMAAELIALDLSNAMFATDLTPNRLSRAKYKIQDIIQAQKEGQIGLVAFTRRAFVVSPLTEDAHTLSALLPVLNPNIMPVQGVDITAGLQKAADLLKQGGVRGGHIILVTANTPTSKDFTTAKNLHQRGFVISILGVATPHGAPIPTTTGFLKNSKGQLVNSKLNTNKLKQFATVGGGYYQTFTGNDTDIRALMKAGHNNQPFRQNHSNIKINEWIDSGHWFILLLLPFAALGFRRGWFEHILQ